MKKISFILIFAFLTILSYSQESKISGYNTIYIKNNSVMSKSANETLGQTLALSISINPTPGSVGLYLNDVVKTWRINYKDNSISWDDVCERIVEYQFVGGDEWVCFDPWKIFPDGFWSGINTDDIFIIRDNLVNMDCIDMSRTIFQPQYGNVKYSVPPYALRGHKKITEVKLPRHTLKIGNSAFKDCMNLICVNGSAFYSSNNVLKRSVRYVNRINMPDYKPDMSVYGEIDLSGLHDPNELVSNAFSHLIEICDSAFFNTSLTRVQLPINIKRIGDEAFGNCNIKNVTLYCNSDITIGNNAFGYHEKDSVILYVDSSYVNEFKRKFPNRFKAIRQIGYISPNPIKIYFKDKRLYVEINNKASETGVIEDNEGNVKKINKGINYFKLDVMKEYLVLVGDEKYRIKKYNY